MPMSAWLYVWVSAYACLACSSACHRGQKWQRKVGGRERGVRERAPRKRWTDGQDICKQAHANTGTQGKAEEKGSPSINTLKSLWDKVLLSYSALSMSLDRSSASRSASRSATIFNHFFLHQRMLRLFRKLSVEGNPHFPGKPFLSIMFKYLCWWIYYIAS